MTDAEVLAIAREHGLTANAHLDAAQAHGRRPEKHVVAPDLCNEQCVNDAEPGESHLRAASLLGLVALSERRSAAAVR